mmetsp:Transcript_28203/g.90181  ORF Transcript_28203/g.90181 Transcript_28203/m.90181 type:complete len:220 (-) Transcript_28203:464-1123(-)
MDRNPTTLIRKAHRGEGSRKFPREAHGHEGLASQRLPRPGRALRLRRRTPRLRRRALLPQPGALHPRARLLVMVALHGAEPAIHQAAREGGEDGFGHCLFGDARGERGDTNLHQGPADDLVGRLRRCCGELCLRLHPGQGLRAGGGHRGDRRRVGLRQPAAHYGWRLWREPLPGSQVRWQGAGRGRRPGAGGALRGGHGAGEAPRGGYRAQGFDGGGER